MAANVVCSITWLSFVLNAYNSSLNSMTIELHVLHQVDSSFFHHSFEFIRLSFHWMQFDLWKWCFDTLMIEQCNFYAFDDLSWWQSASIFPHFSTFFFNSIWIFLLFVFSSIWFTNVIFSKSLSIRHLLLFSYYYRSVCVQTASIHISYSRFLFKSLNDETKSLYSNL